jgi:hypothetical protein
MMSYHSTRCSDCQLFIYSYGLLVTASVVEWSEFLATDPEARVRFPALPDFLKKRKKKERKQ